jgi:antitoxin (DNA-binding transcriptional repressor) of toxin-antitoxin stability system
VKTVDLEDQHIERWVDEAQAEQLVLLRAGKPVALLIGLDEEQDGLGRSARFWELIAERREQPTVSRAELERLLEGG